MWGLFSKRKEKDMTFSEALELLRRGMRVRRAGWNGKGMWLVAIPGSTIKVEAGRPLAAAFPVGTEVKYLSHIDMYTAQGEIVPWLASQTDILAFDWEVVKDV
jgi:hypothetical protein